jgi:hypothetical protein
MRKLKLSIEELEVTSFGTAAAVEGVGTVEANATPVPTKYDPTCDYQNPTCRDEHTCGWMSCIPTCYFGCHIEA